MTLIEIVFSDAAARAAHAHARHGERGHLPAGVMPESQDV